MKLQSRGTRRLTASLAAVAIAALGFAGAGAANAQSDNSAPGQPGAPTEGSLTIHKYAGTPVTTDAHDGTQLPTDPERAPLEGVQFTVTPVTAIGSDQIDLTNPDSWDAIADYDTTPPNPDDFTLGTGVPVTTGADGSVSTNLPVGLYLVEETDAGGHNITAPAQPFLVTLPMPTGDQGWNYDVHVYPKNVIEGVATKEIDDTDAIGAGDEVTWTVTAPPIGVGSGEPLTEFGLTDNLDDRLEYVADSVVVEIDGVAVSSDFFEAQHPGGAGGTLTVAFTQDGLDHLNSLNAGAVVTFAFTTEVIGIGEIPNDAIVNVGGVDYETGEVFTPWGQVIITKIDAATEATLEGATFQVFTNPEGSGSPVSVDVNGTATTDFTTGTDGTVTIPGLKTGTYYLVETQAPAGYTQLTGSIEVTVVAGETTEASTARVEVENTQQSVPALPLTGAAGQLLLIIGGIALLAIAIGLVMYNRRKAALQQ